MFPANYTFLQKLFDTLNWNGTFVLVFRYDHGEGNGGGSFSVKKHGVVCRKWTQLFFFFYIEQQKSFVENPARNPKRSKMHFYGIFRYLKFSV